MRIKRFPSEIVATLSLLASFIGANTSHAQDSLAIAPIEAQFVQADYATHYSVLVSGGDATKYVFTWNLNLTLVDPAHAVSPGGQPPGASVDAGCNNHHVLSATSREFTWHHGDQDGCNHSLEGPHGHQGKITISVTDGTTSCTAEYLGSNTGIGDAPTCTKITSPSPSSQPSSSSPVASAPTSSPALVATKPQVKKAAVPKFTQDEKAKFKTVKHIYAFGSIVTGFISAALALTGAGVPIAVAVGFGSASLAADAEICDIYSEDPPDPNFKVIAVPTVASSSTVKTAGMNPAVANAVVALDINSQQLKALSLALLTSLNRSQGAQQAKNTLWYDKQMLAAKKYALASATLFSQQAALRANLVSALNLPAKYANYSAAQVKDLLSRLPVGTPRPAGAASIQMLMSGALKSADSQLITQLRKFGSSI